MALPLPGYQSMGQMIQNRLDQGLQSRLKQEQLKNALIQSKYAEPMTQADIANKLSQTNKTNFELQNPFLKIPGVSGQLGALALAQQHPELLNNPEAVNAINRGINVNLGNKEAQTALTQKQAAGYDFNSLPVGTKEYVLAQAAGMGIYPDDARKMLTSGKSLSDIATDRGFDPNNLPEPVYPLTKAGQTALKARKAAIEEMDKMSKDITEWSGPYSRQIMGISPKLFKEVMEGKNEEGQAKFYAAQMLAPEQAAIRFKALGGNVGIGAIEEMTHRALLNGRVVQALVSPKVYARANDLVEESIKRAVGAANKESTKAIGSSKPSGNLIAEAAAVTQQPKEDLVQPRFPKNTKVMTYNPKTGRLE